jgi:hypothetical protein
MRLELDLAISDEEDDLEESMLVGGKFKYRLEHLELDRGRNWLKDLKKDKDQLSILLYAAQNVAPETDAKLADLKKLIAAKVAKPTVGDVSLAMADNVKWFKVCVPDSTSTMNLIQKFIAFIDKNPKHTLASTAFQLMLAEEFPCKK